MTPELDPAALMTAMATQLQALINTRQLSAPLLIGIHRGGAWIAEGLRNHLGIHDPIGTLDISFYRDDFSRVGMSPQVRPSDLPLDIDNRHLILVDDVLYTGRTIRAALDELFDYGRPASVLLVTLVDRGGRELPIQADVVGTQITLSDHENIKLSGPDPLSLAIRSRR